MSLHLLHRAALTALLLTAVGAVSATIATTTALEDDALYNQVLFAGTHNSAINLGAACHGRAPGTGCTLGRPAGARGGAFSSLSASGGYQVRRAKVHTHRAHVLVPGSPSHCPIALWRHVYPPSRPPSLPPFLPLSPLSPFSTSVIPIYPHPSLHPHSTQSWTNASAFATS